MATKTFIKGVAIKGGAESFASVGKLILSARIIPGQDALAECEVDSVRFELEFIADILIHGVGIGQEDSGGAGVEFGGGGTLVAVGACDFVCRAWKRSPFKSAVACSPSAKIRASLRSALRSFY